MAHHRAKVPDEIVVTVIVRCERGESERKVAREVGVARTTVQRWVDGTSRRFTLPPDLTARLLRELARP